MPEFMTEDEFDAKFTLVEFPDGQYTSQTTTDPRDIHDIADNKIWTLVDGEDDAVYLVSGKATVNFIGWQATEEPHDAETYEITVKLN